MDDFPIPLEAIEEYRAWKKAKEEREYQEECPHDEHDHYICLDCGKDILDDKIGEAEMLEE